MDLGHRVWSAVLPLKLTQDTHVVSALLLVYLDEVVKRVREILEQSVLLVHLQPKDAVQELGDGAVCGWSCISAAGVTLPTASGSSSSQYFRYLPFSTSKHPERDSRLPMPTDSRPCFMSVKENLTLALIPRHSALPSP